MKSLGHWPTLDSHEATHCEIIEVVEIDIIDI